MKIRNATKLLEFIALAAISLQSVYASNGGCPAGQAGPSTLKAATEQKGNVEVYTES
ncbi:hypothetical protein MUU49_00405 [Scandinavium goeteborgense]|uniref:hypothetical protein n=1 Tax=Scandinavium goeteborgense TaxID=1851514 RepID=UPI002166637C|nr:hypothetical protein [Scandinavium goeteborgense]MCS2151070.1 hypothetical protein [Scandinavium goeteborgense]